MTAALKAIVVEDDHLIAEGLAQTLQDLGHHVCGIAHDVAELSALLGEHDPDLVTMDVNLGQGREGLGVATVLEATGPLAIVFVTGTISEEQQEDIRTTECAALVLKPFTPAQLAVAIEIALERTREDLES
jgi:DNA-binding response OmpR family regulator